MCKLSFDKLVFVTTDGAELMTGENRGFVSKLLRKLHAEYSENHGFSLSYSSISSVFKNIKIGRCIENRNKKTYMYPRFGTWVDRATTFYTNQVTDCTQTKQKL